MEVYLPMSKNTNKKVKKNIKKEFDGRSEIVKDKVVVTRLKIRSFWAGIKRRYNSRKTKLKKYFKSDDFKIPVKAVFSILMDGFIFSIAISYFITFTFLNVFVFGCLWYFLRKKILPEIKSLLTSFSLIRITK